MAISFSFSEQASWLKSEFWPAGAIDTVINELNFEHQSMF
jgi:hypothetical protein